MATLRQLRISLYTGISAILVILLILGLKHSPSIAPQLPSLPWVSNATDASHQDESPAPVSTSSPQPAPISNDGKERYAYVTWLSSTVVGEKSEKLDEDVYFIGTRILIWQLLHDPETKAEGIDVIVAVTPDVSASRRERLRKDGAIVRSIEFVHGKNDSWLHPKESRWNDIMSKLRVWEFTEYSKIAMLDGDMILNHRLDGIFQDPGARIMQTMRDRPTKDDEPALPDTYMLGSIGEVAGADHEYPPTWETGLKKKGYFCAGFFLLQPSKELFNYYTALLDIPMRFDPKYMEQNLLNYAHRWDGPMPWKEIAYTWNIRSVNDNDLDKGVVSMHEKWWEKPLSDSQRVKDIFQKVRWKMEGFYAAYDQVHNSTHD